MKSIPVVLIVENDPATHQLYARALKAEYDVLVASNAQEAQSMLDAHSVQAIVLEPGPIGSPNWALIANIKQHPSSRTIPLILCTAQDERRQGLEMGATVYLTKPVLPTALVKAVRNVIVPTPQKGKSR